MISSSKSLVLILILMSLISGFAGGVFVFTVINYPESLFSPSGPVNSTSTNPITGRVVVENSTRFAEIIPEMEKLIGLVKFQNSAGATETRTGTILTSDGLIATAADNITQSTIISFDNTVFDTRASLTAEKNGAALLSMKPSNKLAIASLTDIENLELGQHLGILALKLKEESLEPFFNEATVRIVTKDGFEINITESDPSFNGAPIFDEAGNVYGIVLINKNKTPSVFSSNEIRALLSSGAANN